MDISYFQKINNSYKSQSKQETDLYLLNRHVDECFADTIDYHIVKRNGEPFELLIIKDSDSNTFKKKIKSKHSTPFKMGDYIEWNNQIWIVTLLDPDDKTYHSGYMCLCTIVLRWQNHNGDIIERWGYLENFTKYSNGVEENKVLTLGDNQYGITIPVDSETKHLKRDRRFAIDLSDVEQPDVYKLTNKTSLYNDYNYLLNGGLINLTLSFTEFNANTDKKITLQNGKEAWVCDYVPISPPPTFDKSEILSKIDGRTNLKIGFRRTYTVTFFNQNEETLPTPVNFSWNVICDFSDKLSQEVDGNNISFYVDEEDLVSEKFILQSVIGSKVSSEITVEITGIY